MKAVSILTIGRKQGSPRLWIENQSALRAGFIPGLRFNVREHGQGIVLEVSEDGARTVSGKSKGDRITPVIDINSRGDLESVSDHQTVRIIYGRLRIYISPLASELRRVRRLKRLRSNLESGCITTAGLAAGGGIMSHAIQAGLSDAGLRSSCAVFNEIRADLTEQACCVNEVIMDETVVANVPLQELVFDDEVMRRLPEVDVLEMGIPCSGASSAGRAKNKIAHPEDHPHVGHLVAGLVAAIAKFNPAALLLECVVNYSHSASAAVLRTMLCDLGYDVHECVLNGTDWGELEARERWYLVGVTRGIAFDFERLVPERYPVRYLAEVLEDVADDDPRWSAMQYLRDKEVRDLAAGKGFRMQIFDGSEIAINTLTKGLSKRRSTDPMIAHPSDPLLMRTPTVVEHARCKGVPERLVAGLSQTIGHEMLGQSVVYRPVRRLAQFLGEALRRAAFAPILPSQAVIKAAS